MSLDYAILGFLNYQPFSGYDLKKIFDTSVQHFWSADQSQIYRVLARLTEQGLAEMEVVAQSDRPDRKVYHITPAGQAALRDWLGGPIPCEASHSASLIQVFFSGLLPDEQVRAKFEEARQLFSANLERLNQVPGQIQEYIRMVDSPRETYFWLLTLELGIKETQLQIEWAEKVLRMLAEQDVPPS